MIGYPGRVPYAPAGYSPDRVPDRPVFFIQSQHNPDLVLDVDGGNTYRGTKLIVWQRKASDYANQLFTFTPEGFIENVKSGLVLDIEGGGGAGSRVIIWDKKPTHQAENQRWQYDYTNQTFHCLHRGFVLDIDGGSRAPGAKIIAWHPKGSDNSNQRFNLIPASVPAPSPYVPAPVVYPGPPVGFPHQPVVLPSPIVMPSPIMMPSPGFGGPAQGFGQSFWIQSTFNDLVLDVDGGSTSPGAHVILWPKKGHHDSKNQLWRFTADGFIESAQTGLVLDIKGGGGAGSHIIVWNKKAPHEAHNQRWTFNNAAGTIIGKEGVVLDIEGGNRNQGTKLCVWHAKRQHENNNQRWRLIPFH